MSDDDIPASLAEATAEICRLDAEDERLRNSMLKLLDERAYFLREIDLLRARVAELEAIVASNVVMLGTLEQPTDDAPFHVEHDVPPSTPR